MNLIDSVVIARSDYSVLCFAAGLGWGLFVATFTAAIIINHVRWNRWVNGR
jgi:hypothetical protein